MCHTSRCIFSGSTTTPTSSYPDAILLSRISREGVFQKSSAISLLSGIGDSESHGSQVSAEGFEPSPTLPRSGSFGGRRIPFNRPLQLGRCVQNQDHKFATLHAQCTPSCFLYRLDRHRGKEFLFVVGTVFRIGGQQCFQRIVLRPVTLLVPEIKFRMHPIFELVSDGLQLPVDEAARGIASKDKRAVPVCAKAPLTFRNGLSSGDCGTPQYGIGGGEGACPRRMGVMEMPDRWQG